MHVRKGDFMDKIYLDQDGYQNYLKEIEDIREKIRLNSSDISEYMGDDAYGDGWHDNFAYEQAIKKENALFYELHKKLEGLKDIEIVDKKIGSNLVELGSIVELEIDGEIEIYKLTGDTVSNFNGEIFSITLNSLLGKSIYHKCVGDSFLYKADNNVISGKIICIK